MSVYSPGWESKEYHSLSRGQRRKIADEVDKLFQQETGVSRKLNPRSTADLDLRIKWLKLRDKLLQKQEEEIQLELDAMRKDGVVTAIPGEMEYMGWPEGAKLLETWFERGPAVAPNYSAPVTDLIKMDWVLKFGRAKAVYDEIFADKIWKNDAGKKRLKELLKKKPRSPGQRWGDLSQAVTTVDDEWVNSRAVKGGLSWDPLAGALGSFTLQVAVAGKIVAVSSSDIQISIDEVGVYVKDSFDFNGDQFLGIWGYRDDPINNSDFRTWRANNGAGGDFRVFSDIKRTKLAPEVVQVFL